MITTEPCFNPFDPRKEVRVYWRHLPHWRQDGACYFVTYRLNDSIPASIFNGWQEERRIWLDAHGMDPEHPDPKAYQRILPTERRQFERRHHRLLQDSLDHGHGSCLLRRRDNAVEALNALLFFHGERCWTGDAVIMPNHIHALIVPIVGFELESLLQSVKRHSARMINVREQQQGSLWQKDSHDHIVRNERQLLAFRKYIARNANQAGLKAGDGAYHRADWLDDDAPVDQWGDTDTGPAARDDSKSSD